MAVRRGGSSAAGDPAGFDTVIIATSLGHNGQGPLPIEISRASGTALVVDVVSVPEDTPLLHAAQARGLRSVRGVEMMTPQIEAIADFPGMTAHGFMARDGIA